MTTLTAPQPTGSSLSERTPPVPQRPPLRVFLTVLHLAALGVFGWGIIGTCIGLFAAGTSLIFVFGLGVIPLIGLVYVLYGLAWFETERVDGLYHQGLPSLTMRTRTQPGFGGYLRFIGRQAIDARMWLALANFALASLMGVALLWLIRLAVWFASRLSAPGGTTDFMQGLLGFRTPERLQRLVDGTAGWNPLIGALGLLLVAAAAVGLVLLHRASSVRLLGATLREDELIARAHASAVQREGAVRAADVERTRIERDLHDGVQPRLVSVGMSLGLAQEKIDDDPTAAKALIAEAHTSTKAAITELRQLARGIHASVLEDRGLDAALSALAARSPIPVHLDARLDHRCSREAETAVYFSIAESLTNAAKHSRADECRVTVRVRDGNTLWARIEDNGIGGARVLAGGGLDGIANRVAAAGGSVRLDSPQGGPTALEVSIPCAS